MNKKLTFTDLLFWTIASLAIAFNGILCFASIRDIYNVAFTDMDKEYHFGSDAMGRFYSTKNTYLTYSGIMTALFLIILFFQIYYGVKINKKKEMYSGLALIIIITLIWFINKQIYS